MTITPTAPAHVALELSGIAKSFGAVVALANGTVAIRSGEIHALVGENGAGKSTMVKIIAGIYQPDSGEILLNGELTHLRDAAAAKAAGISVIYQEPTLFPDLTVAENIFMGRQPRGRLGLVDRQKMRSEARALFARLGVPIDPDRVAEGLSIADQQIIEIAKAISMDAKILVMDEPTAALSGAEVDRLFDVARSLRDGGAGILFISHRFDEIFGLCDRITVMRDGAFVGLHDVGDITADGLVREMVGRDIGALYPKQEATLGDTVVSVRDLHSAGVFEGISFDVRAGEIVALSGLVGAGRTEVARAIFGIDRYDSGSVLVGGAPLRKHSPQASIDAGMGFVPEDRRKQGLVMELSVAKNATLTLRNQLAKFGLIRSKAERDEADTWTRRLQVKTGSLDLPVSTLSGGNQQKVVLAKWLATNPKFLIVDEPTRGIDVGTKSEVHRLISELAGQGIAVLMISSELPEVLGMADTILVMHEGSITAKIARADATAEAVMHAGKLQRRGDLVSATTFRAEQPGAVRALRRIVVSREFSVFAALALLIIVTTAINPRFLSPQGINDILLNSSIFVVMAVGETLVIVTRNVDLSVGSMLGLTAYSTGAVYAAFPHIPLIFVFVVGVVFGAVLGAINGLIVGAAKVPALVITLGTLYVYRGINYAWSGSNQYFVGNDPAEFGNLSVQTFYGLPILAIIALGAIVVFGVYMWGARSGRDLYAIGSDPAAARVFGIPVDARVFGAFVACGALTGLAGVLYASRFNSVGADTGTGYELQIVAAVVVGGVAIFGGSGTAVGAGIGAILLTTMTGALAALNVNKFWQQAVVGVLIIAAILITRIIALRNTRKLRVSEARNV